MSNSLFALCALVATVTATSLAVSPDAFNDWCSLHDKRFGSLAEHQQRRANFYANRGAGGNGSMWHMLDRSAAELARLRGYAAPDSLPAVGFPSDVDQFHATSRVEELPESFDWRSKSVVSAVKVQGQGSSCWSFSAVGAIEGATAIASKGKAVSLSNQQIMDCSHVDCLDAINGTMTGAYHNIVGWGGTIDTDQDYPYRDANCVSWDARCNPSMIDPRCKFWAPPHVCQTNHTAAAKISGYKHTRIGNETDLLLAASIGPVAVAIDASHSDFAGYFNGIYENPLCASEKSGLDHAVLLVGWGTQGEGKDYWVVKNSWGNHLVLMNLVTTFKSDSAQLGPQPESMTN